MAKVKLLDKLKGASGWSASVRLSHDIKDANGNVIQRVWIQPLNRRMQTELSDSGPTDLTLRMLCKCLFDSEKEGAPVFSVTDIPEMKRELNHFMLNDLELAMINVGKPTTDEAKQIIEEEKKDSETTV